MGRLLRKAGSAGAALLTLVAGYGASRLAPRLSCRHNDRKKSSEHQVSQTSSVSASSSGRVRLLSQNVWNSFFAGGPDRLRRLDAFREWLEDHDVDVVVTQEMFELGLGPFLDQSDSAAAREAMKSLGLSHCAHGEPAPFLGQNSGLVIYSRLPIRRHEEHVFNARRAVSCKGWLEIEMELPSASEAELPRRLLLFNTHLEHAHSERWRCVREQQWRQLAGRVEEVMNHSPRGTLVVVLGDFNVCSDDLGVHIDGGAEYASICETMRVAGLKADLVQHAHAAGLPTMRLAPSPKALRCSVDHAFANAAFVNCVSQTIVVDTRGLDGSPVSDHHGICMDLRI